MAGHRNPEYLAATAVRDTMMTIPDYIPIIAVYIAAATFFWRVWLSAQSERRRKQELINAVYHHVDEAIGRLKDEEREKRNKTIRQRIEDDESYTPYVVRSSSDDLTYDHIIGVMEWLDEKGEKAVASYFYSQSSLHAAEESFGLEYVRSWPASRKLQLWSLYVKYQEKTLESAMAARKALSKGGKLSENQGNGKES